MESLGSLIAYAAIALTIVVFSVLAVTTGKILRSATFLLFALFGVAAAYFMLGYQFLGAVQIAVYGGGIVVLVVFAILLTSHPGATAKKLESKKRTLGILGALATLVICVWSLVDRCQMLKPMPDADEMTDGSINAIGTKMLSSADGGYLLPFEAISVLLLACIIGGLIVARKKND